MRFCRCRLSGEASEVQSTLASHASKGRLGVADPGNGVEVYLVTPGGLARRLLASAQSATEQGQQLPEVDLQDDLSSQQLLALVVYRKVWLQHVCDKATCLQLGGQEDASGLVSLNGASSCCPKPRASDGWQLSHSGCGGW